MLGRFIRIAGLLIKLAVSYASLLLVRKKYKSCLVHAHFEKSGGTRTYFFHLIEYLSRNKFEINVLLAKDQADDEISELQLKYPFTILEQNFKIQKTTFTGTIFYKRNQENFIYQLQELNFFLQIFRKYKCSRCIISEANPEALLFLFLSPLKVFYILHTVATDSLDKLKRKMLNYSLSAKKQIITVSNYSKEILLNNWVSLKNRDDVKVVHNFYEPEQTDLLVKKSKTKTILTIGTVVQYKNPLFWIAVCKEILAEYEGDIEFIWAGEGELLDECRKECAQFPAIKFVGYRKDVEQLYADCDIYFQPSILESHGMAVLGAMYFGKPCVVSDRQGLPESVANNITGLFVSIDDPRDSQEAIISLLNNEDQAKQFGKAAKEKVMSDFSKSKWTANMDFIFN